MSSTVTTPTTPVTPTPDPTGVSGSWTPDPDVTAHPLWQRVKDAVELPVGQYDQKYAADDAAVQDKINGVLGHLIPFYKEVSATQPAIEKTKLGKQTGEFVKEQLAHPEQIALGGEFGGENVPTAAIEGAAKIGEHLKETGKTAAKAAVEEGKAAVAAKAPVGSAEAGKVPLTFDHKPSAHVGEVIARDPQGNEVGHISYTLDQTDHPKAHITSALLEPEHQGQGYGQQMYLEAAKQAKSRGATSLTSDVLDPTSEDAAHVWDALRRQGHPVEKLGGKNNYTMDLSQLPETEISNQVESSAAAPAKDFSSVGGVKVERRSPDSLGRTPGSVMKKVTDTTYQTMREHGLDTASPEAPAASGKFAPVDGVELRQPTTFGRTGGSFGRTVDQTYDVLRAQEKPAVEVSNQVESNKTPSKLPSQPKLPDTGTYAAIKTDDGSIYPDTEPEKQRTHIMLAQDLGIPADRIVSGGWLKDGEYEGSERSDAGRYGERARAQKAVEEKRANISNQLESNVAAPAIHPDLQKLSDKYGVSDDPEKVRNGASFIRPDGRFVHLGTTEHPVAIEKTTGERPTEDLESLGDKIANSSGPEDSRVRFLADTGAIRTRFHYGRNGDETLSVSVPEKGVTEEQVSALKNAFQSSMDHGRGNLVMEIGTPHGKSTQADYVTANEIEPALARIGAMPNQRVNLSDAYGDTGTYIGGHVPLQAGGIGDFPSFQERQQARDIGITHGPALLDAPASRLDPKQTTLSMIHHEVGHIVAAHQEGIPLDDSYIGSHLSLHSQQTGGAAYTNFNFTKLPGARAVGDNAQFTADGLAKAFPRLLHTLLGGGAVEEILDGIPMKQNEGMGGDLSQIRGIGRALGLTPDETEAQISKGMNDTKARLNKPEILDIIKNASATREEGLSKTLHMSKERVQRDIIQKLNEVTSGKRTNDLSTSTGDLAGTVRGANQGIGEAASSREGQVSGGAAKGNEPASVQGTLFSKKVESSEPEQKVRDKFGVESSDNLNASPRFIWNDGKITTGLSTHEDMADHALGIDPKKIGVTAVPEFLRKTGAVRVDDSEDFNVQLIKPPTPQQLRAIATAGKGRDFVWDLGDTGNVTSGTGKIGDLQRAIDAKWKENQEIKNTVESSKAVASKATRKKALTSKSK